MLFNFLKKDKNIVGKVTISMQYSAINGFGIAATEWDIPDKNTGISKDEMRILLCCALLGRVLIIHKESREKIIEVIMNSIKHFEATSQVKFENWVLSAGGRSFTIWPWDEGQFSKGCKYIGTIDEVEGHFLFNLKMAVGQERILVPSSILLALKSAVKNLSPDKVQTLFRGLTSVINHINTSDGYVIGSDISALRHALFNIHDLP